MICVCCVCMLCVYILYISCVVRCLRCVRVYDVCVCMFCVCMLCVCLHTMRVRCVHAVCLVCVCMLCVCAHMSVACVWCVRILCTYYVCVYCHWRTVVHNIFFDFAIKIAQLFSQTHRKSSARMRAAHMCSYTHSVYDCTHAQPHTYTCTSIPTTAPSCYHITARHTHDNLRHI